MTVTKEVSKTFLSWIFSRCQGGKGTMFARRDHYLQIFCLAENHYQLSEAYRLFCGLSFDILSLICFSYTFYPKSNNTEMLSELA